MASIVAGPAHGDAGLRAAEQLVAAEGHDVGAGGHALLERRLLREELERGEGAAAEVVDQHGAALVRQRRELLHRRLRREADDAVVAGVDAQHGARALRPGLLEVPEVGAVGGADLDHVGAALAHDVGDAEPVADLHELAAADEHLAAAAVAATASSTAAALLLTTSASSAPVTAQSASWTWSWREARSPRARLYSRSV
jgi:hypothetical protein